MHSSPIARRPRPAAFLSRLLRNLLALLLAGPALAADLLLFVLLRKLPEPPATGRYSIWRSGFTHLLF